MDSSDPAGHTTVWLCADTLRVDSLAACATHFCSRVVLVDSATSGRWVQQRYGMVAACLLARVIQLVVPVHGCDCSDDSPSNSVAASAHPAQEGISGGMRSFPDHTALVYRCSVECSAARGGDEGGANGSGSSQGSGSDQCSDKKLAAGTGHGWRQLEVIGSVPTAAAPSLEEHSSCSETERVGARGM